MPSVQGYRLNQQAVKQQRPLGLAVLATIGMLGNLAVLVVSFVRLLPLLSASASPSLQLATVVGVLVVTLVSLWINWGFWEMIRWAWWANMLLSLVSIGVLIVGLRLAQPLGAMLAKMRPTISEGQVSTVMMAGLLALLVYQLIVILYMFSVRATFGVGVKDDRPIWERANRRQQR
jgi:hypothetical protein